MADRIPETTDERETGGDWIAFDEVRPQSKGFYEWKHEHKLGFTQKFFAEMRVRGAGVRDVLSPRFDHWDGYRVHVPNGMYWRETDIVDAEKRARDCVVKIDDLWLRECPFCGRTPTITARQCGYPGGGNGVVILASPQNYNTWSVERCCRMIGHNGFKHPDELARTWNARGQS